MMRFPHRSLIRLSGPDTIALLERTVTHSVKDWAAGEVRYGALLTPQGKIISDYTVLRTDNGVLLDVHEDAAEDLMKRLKLFRLRAQVEITLDETLAAVRADDAADPRSPALWGRRWVPVTEAGEMIADADWTANRIAAGVPEWGSDYRAAEVFPTDINMDVMGGIDYKKGCFIGQEVASRMKRRGKIRKRTLIVHGTGIVTGSDILATTPVGTVTSATGETGLALVRTDRLQKALTEGTDLTCNEGPIRFELQDWAEAELAEVNGDE